MLAGSHNRGRLRQRFRDRAANREADGRRERHQFRRMSRMSLGFQASKLELRIMRYELTDDECALALLRLSHFRTENRIPLFLKML
jgi:hypothetical protein